MDLLQMNEPTTKCVKGGVSYRNAFQAAFQSMGDSTDWAQMPLNCKAILFWETLFDCSIEAPMSEICTSFVCALDISTADLVSGTLWYQFWLCLYRKVKQKCKLARKTKKKLFKIPNSKVVVARIVLLCYRSICNNIG